MSEAHPVSLFITMSSNRIGNNTASLRLRSCSNAASTSFSTELVVLSRSPTQIQIGWKDNSDNEAQFKIERSTDGRTFWPLGAAAPNATTYSNLGVTSGRLYWYRVYAINAAGGSTLSNVVQAAVPFPTTTTASAPAPAAAFSTTRLSEEEPLFA